MLHFPGAQVSLRGKENASLVVIGAHHFGGDPNDPIFRSVRSITWQGVILLEASPPVSRELRKLWKGGGDTASFATPADDVHIVNAGVCTKDAKGALPFYSFVGNNSFAEEADGLLKRQVGGHDGLPYWRTQIGSFDGSFVMKWSEHMLRKYTSLGPDGVLPPLMNRYVKVDNVRCHSLERVLRHPGLRGGRPALLVIDTESLDCRIVASHDWCEPDRAPEILIFEHIHCSTM